MPVKFNHAIVYARDSRASAAFLAELLGLSGPTRWGPFHVVTTDNDGNVDFMNADGDITPQHYAFWSARRILRKIIKRIRDRGLCYWADPAQTTEGDINRHDGGRGLYFEDPDAMALPRKVCPVSLHAATARFCGRSEGED